MIGMALIAFTGHLIIAAINIRKIPQRIARRQAALKQQFERQVANNLTKTNTLEIMETAVPNEIVFALPGALVVDNEKDFRILKLLDPLDLSTHLAEPFEAGLKQRAKGRFVSVKLLIGI
jgi:hypothetical protein